MFYCVESFYYLLVSKIKITFFPFSWYKHQYGLFQCETLMVDLHEEEKIFSLIASSTKRVAKRLPWKSQCLDQAMAVQCMLRRRGLQNTLYFGMTKNQNGKWLAHAWVRSGCTWVIGYHENVSYTVVGTYAQLS